MPPFFNRLQNLIPSPTYPIGVNPLQASSLIGTNPDITDSGDSGYVGQDVGNVNNRLGQLGQASDEDEEYNTLSRRLQQAALNTPAMNAYQRYVANPPNPANYQPGKLGRLAATLGGFAAGWQDPARGVNLARNILDEPYQQALLQYQQRGKGLEQSALAEERGISNLSRATNEALQRMEQRRSNIEKEANRRQETQIKEDREKIWALVQQDRYNTVRDGGDGYIHVIKKDGTDINTGVPAIKLAQDEVISRIHQNRMAEIAAGGEQRRLTEAQIAQHRMGLAQFAATHKGWQFKFQPGGNVLAMNPSDPYSLTDTGVDSGIASEDEKQQNRIVLKQTPGAPRETDTTLDPIPGTGWWGFGQQKQRTTVTGPPKPKAGQQPPKQKTDADYRAQAMQILQNANPPQPVVEENIQHVIAKLKAQENAGRTK